MQSLASEVNGILTIWGILTNVFLYCYYCVYYKLSFFFKS